jgi:TFIIF-interacting CTD phosphatase-like protein
MYMQNQKLKYILKYMHIVLDLDETLVCVSLEPTTHPDFKFKLDGLTYYGRKRPGLDLFLSYVFKKFKTVNIWTAATRPYGTIILNNIMTPSQIKRLTFFNTREDLTKVEGGSCTKQLKKIFNGKHGLTPADTIMIDDRADVLRDNPGNGIKIPAWKGDKSDKYLPKLIIILEGIFYHNIGFGHFPSVLDLTTLVD